MKKINFHKFIWAVLEKKKRRMNIIFGTFSNSLKIIEKKKTKKKKGDAEPEMGYCPFEHKAGLGAGLCMGRVGVRGKDTRRCAAQHGRWARMRERGARARAGRWGTALACGRQALGARQANEGARGTRGTGAWHGRGVQVCGLGVLLGYGLCTWCTQLVFDSV